MVIVDESLMEPLVLPVPIRRVPALIVVLPV